MKRFTSIGVAVLLPLAACTTETADQQPVDLPAEPAAEVEAEPVVGITDEGPNTHLVYRSPEIEWEAGPPSFEEGAEFAVLEGDPSEAGVFTMRLRFPDRFEIAPHWHPNVERVTVVSGTFLLGTGDEINREAAERLDAGSYTSIPPEMRHFAIAAGETVVQLTSVGPWEINYVNPADDPRSRN